MTTTPLAERFWANFALLAAFGTVLVAVMRTYAWSGFSLPVGLAVLSVADRTTLLASTLLLVVVSLVPLMLSELTFSPHFSLRGLFDPDLSTRDAIARFGALGGLLFIAYGLAPLYALVSIGSLLVLIFLGWLVVLIVARIRGGQESAASVARAKLFTNPAQSRSLLVLVSAGTIGAVLGQSWLPLESIELTKPNRTVIGYLVGAQGEFTLVLNEAKEAEWVPTETVEDRTLCSRSTDDLWFRPVAALIGPTFLAQCGADVRP